MARCNGCRRQIDIIEIRSHGGYCSACYACGMYVEIREDVGE